MEKKRIMENRPEALKDEAIRQIGGGYVVVNPAGCYELYRDDGRYEATFRGDQLMELRAYARAHGISDEFV